MTARSTRNTVPSVSFRAPVTADGQKLWRLAKDSECLEENSCYAYLLLATHFSDTCLLAENCGEPIGFVAAYRPPAQPEVVFVWQVGVTAAERGRGLGRAMLQRLLDLPACTGVRFLQATVTPSNLASRKLFESVAKALGASFETSAGFKVADFPHGEHEDEQLITIGPLEVS